jgi:hypothetical protein
MWAVETASKVRNLAAQSELCISADRKLALSVAVLRTVIRRQPHIGAGVVAYWLRK